MANEKISQFTTTTDFTNVFVAGIDLTRELGDRNVKIAAAGLAAAASGGTVPTVTTTLNISITLDGQTDVQLMSPVATDTDISVLGLAFRSPTIAAAKYNLQIYAGNPASGGTLLFDYFATFSVMLGSDGQWTYNYPSLLYLPASIGSNQLWVRLINADLKAIKLNAQAITIEYSGHGIQLPGWVDPAPYTGPLLDEVFVGPTRTFIEPRFALAALADGGTMHIDPGTYYYPFGITWDVTQSGVSASFGYNPSSPSGAARFVEGITIIGSGTYNDAPTIFNGRGGFGLLSTHPFRMVHGQGFVWTNSPLTISGVRFMFCGGDDQNSDGEAGIYALGFQTPGDLNVTQCAFDGNENGIFTQQWHGETPGETDISNATGPGKNITVTLDHCDFGFLLPNGCGGDGFSHDFYINSLEVNVTDCNFYGALSDWKNYGICPPLRSANTIISPEPGVVINPVTSGNCMKSRSRYFNVDGCWVRSNSGKLIDRPDGGTFIVNNTVFTNLEPSSALSMGYNTEQLYAIPLTDPVFTNCTFYFNRVAGFGTVWWIKDATHKFDCSDTGNAVVWNSSSCGWVINRTNSGFGYDPTCLSGLDSEFVARTDGGGLIASGTATFGAPPAAPTPASLAGGDTLGDGIHALVP